MVKQISYNEIYLLIKYIKSVLWRVAKRLSYIEEVRCLKVKQVRRDILWLNVTIHDKSELYMTIRQNLLYFNQLNNIMN